MAPLLRYGADDEEWCVLLVNRKVAHLLRPGDRAGGIEQLEDDTHGQHQQGGRSQANYQRSVEQEKLTHLQRSLDTLFTHFKRSRFDHLVLGSPEDMAGDVEDRIRPYLRERLAGRISIDVENTGADEVQAAAAVVVEERTTARGREAASTAWRRASGAGRAARHRRRRSGTRAGARGAAAAGRRLRRAGARERDRAGDHPVGRRPGGAPPRRPRASGGIGAVLRF